MTATIRIRNHEAYTKIEYAHRDGWVTISLDTKRGTIEVDCTGPRFDDPIGELTIPADEAADFLVALQVWIEALPGHGPIVPVPDALLEDA